jgi:hypothetical protein
MYLAVLKDHLGFIERFYNTAAEPFESRMRKIEAQEEPFVPRHPCRDDDEFEYQAEWSDAYEGLNVLGSCSLGLLEKALHDYLREFVGAEGELARRNPESRGSTITAASWKKTQHSVGRIHLCPKATSKKLISPEIPSRTTRCSATRGHCKRSITSKRIQSQPLRIRYSRGINQRGRKTAESGCTESHAWEPHRSHRVRPAVLWFRCSSKKQPVCGYGHSSHLNAPEGAGMSAALEAIAKQIDAVNTAMQAFE